MGEQERLAAAQKLLNEMAQKYGVTLAVASRVTKTEDGGVIVSPQMSLQLIPEWKAPEHADH